MAALSDYFKKNGNGSSKPATSEFDRSTVGKNVGTAYGGLIGKAFLATDVVGIATADNKLKAMLKTARDLAFIRIIWPTALLGALSGIQTVFRHLVVDSGSLAAAIERIKTISVYQGQFEPLLKGVGQAKQRVAELMTFAAKSPFSLDSVVQASRSLEIYTKGAMGAGASLKMVENIARASGTSIESAADAFGSLYRSVQNGEPIAAASQEIQRMGLLSAQTADKMQRLQDTGATSAQIWLNVAEAIKVNSRQTDKYSESLEGVTKQLDAQQQKNKAGFAAQFVPGEVQGAKFSLGTAKNLQPVMETLGSTIADVTTVGENFTKWIAKTITGIPGLATVTGTAAKSFVILAESVALLATFKGLQGIGEWVKSLYDAGASLKKVDVAVKLAASSISLLDKATVASDNGHKMLAKGYGLLGNFLGKASGAVGTLTVSLRGLAVAAATNPITWIAAAVAAVSVIWQMNEATNAAAKSLNDLSEANGDILKSNKQMIDAIQTEDDAYAALAKTITEAKEAKKKLHELPPAEEKPGLMERITNSPFFPGAPTTQGVRDNIAGKGGDILGAGARRDIANSKRENQQFTADTLDKRAEVIEQKIGSGDLIASKNKQAVLEQAATRKVRLDDMQRENQIQLATGHDKLKLMEEQQAVEANKGREGEAAAKARAEHEGRATEIKMRGERVGQTPEQINEQIATVARVSPSKIIRQEQAVLDMKPGQGESKTDFSRRQEDAFIAVKVARVDLETNRDVHIEKDKGLQVAIQEGVLQQKLADVRLTAEEKIADLKSVGVEKAKEEYAIKMAALDATMRTQIAAGRPEEARSTRAQMQAAKQEQFEGTRQVEVTRAQFQLELEQHATRRSGKTEQSQALEDINAFISHFEELRTQFGEPEARTMAIEKRKDELMQQQNATGGVVVASSLQRIGGGGGVYGVNADSVQRVQERIADLTSKSNTILQHIDANTKDRTETASGVEVPAVTSVTAEAEKAQQAQVASANIVVPGEAQTVPPAIAITKTPAASAAPEIPAGLQTPPVKPQARIVVPGEGRSTPSISTITNPPKTPEEKQAMINRMHGIYGIPKFGMAPHDEKKGPEELPMPSLRQPGTGGRNAFESPEVEKILSTVTGTGTGKETLNSILGSVTEPGRKPGLAAVDRQSAPYAPSPNRLQSVLSDRESNEPFAEGPNFQTMQILRTLKDIHERHVESNGHLDTIAGKEAGVQ